MQSKSSSSVVADLASLIIWLLILGGWVANIVQLIQHINDPLTGFELARMFGILIFPLGCILGWIGILS